MKVLLFTILLLSTMFAFAHEEPPKTLLEKKNKSEEKKRIANSGIQYITVYRLTENETKRTKMMRMNYDSDGTYLSVESFADDTMDLRVEFGYSEMGNMISNTDFDPDGNMLEKSIFAFDQEGRVSGGQSFDDINNLVATFFFIHSPDKRSIEFHKFKEPEKLDYKLIYTYTEDFDNVDYAAVVKLSPDGDQQTRVIKNYDIQGILIDKIVYNADDNILHSFRYSYNDKGNCSTIERYNHEGEKIRMDHYIYNYDGLLTEQTAFDNDGAILFRLIYEFEKY